MTAVLWVLCEDLVELAAVLFLSEFEGREQQLRALRLGLALRLEVLWEGGVGGRSGRAEWEGGVGGRSTEHGASDRSAWMQTEAAAWRRAGSAVSGSRCASVSALLHLLERLLASLPLARAFAQVGENELRARERTCEARSGEETGHGASVSRCVCPPCRKAVCMVCRVHSHSHPRVHLHVDVAFVCIPQTRAHLGTQVEVDACEFDGRVAGEVEG